MVTYDSDQLLKQKYALLELYVEQLKNIQQNTNTPLFSAYTSEIYALLPHLASDIQEQLDQILQKGLIMYEIGKKCKLSENDMLELETIIDEATKLSFQLKS